MEKTFDSSVYHILDQQGCVRVQVEGHVTRVKLIKRIMYGKAGFALLRQRVLHRI